MSPPGSKFICVLNFDNFQCSSPLDPEKITFTICKKKTVKYSPRKNYVLPALNYIKILTNLRSVQQSVVHPADFLLKQDARWINLHQKYLQNKIKRKYTWNSLSPSREVFLEATLLPTTRIIFPPWKHGYYFYYNIVTASMPAATLKIVNGSAAPPSSNRKYKLQQCEYMPDYKIGRKIGW